jgi:hypothetical protein
MATVYVNVYKWTHFTLYGQIWAQEQTYPTQEEAEKHAVRTVFREYLGAKPLEVG